MAQETAAVESVLREAQAELLERWVATLSGGPDLRRDLLSEGELRTECQRFLGALAQAVAAAQSTDTTGPAWDPVREQLTALSRSRATQGFTPTETAMFIFSLKEPLSAELQVRHGDDAAGLAGALRSMTAMLDQLGLFTAEAYLRSREDVIRRQQDELIELSTPVVKLWEGVVAVPLIGTLDSARTQVVMESLLERIVATDSTIAIIDITGVPTVDTLVAQHLLKTVAAARLMGADCIISGIRPQIAQTIVHLGLDLSEVTTKASLADAVVVALQRTGFEIVRSRTAVT
jgi:rsbT co-antagonist protein RsbR